MIGLGKRVKEARELRGLNQTELAKAVGIQQSSVSDIETGETKMIEADTLVGLCRALKVRAEWLWTGAKPMTNVAPEPAMPDGLRDVIAGYKVASPGVKDAFEVLARNELSKSAKTLRK